MKISKIILLLTVYSLLTVPLYAQNTWIDSIRKVAATQIEDTNKVWILSNMSDYYLFNDPDSGILCAKQALALAEKLKYDKGIFWSIQSLHNSLHITGNYTEELNYALKALPIAKRLNDPDVSGRSNGMIALSYVGLGDYTSAMKYISVVMRTIAEHAPGDLWSGYAAIVPVYVGLHQYDSALIFGRKSLELLKAQPALYVGNDVYSKIAKSQVYLFLGAALEANAMYDSALYYYRKSIPLSVEMNTKIFSMDAYNGMSKSFKEQHQYDSSIWYAKKVLADKLTNAYPAAKLKAANLLADVYENEKITDSSLKYLRIAENLKDSIYSREKTSAFQNALLKEQEKQKEIQDATTALRNQYRFQQKEKENEAAAATEKLKNQYRMYFLIATFIVLIIITGTVIRNRRIKQLQNIRNSIADDLHDDIGSTLSSISIMNELAKEKSPEALSLLSSIGESTSAMQENMSDIVWTVNPKNDNFENVLQRMELFATEILDAKNIQLELNNDASLNNAKLTMKQRKNLYLFFKEAINNAAKHSGAKKITVNITKKEQSIEMNIADNGSGFSTSEIFSGNGMNSLKKRADELNGKYNITSFTNEGTTIQLRFKIT